MNFIKNIITSRTTSEKAVMAETEAPLTPDEDVETAVSSSLTDPKPASGLCLDKIAPNLAPKKELHEMGYGAQDRHPKPVIFRNPIEPQTSPLEEASDLAQEDDLDLQNDEPPMDYQSDVAADPQDQTEIRKATQPLPDAQETLAQEDAAFDDDNFLLERLNTSLQSPAPVTQPFAAFTVQTGPKTAPAPQGSVADVATMYSGDSSQGMSLPPSVEGQNTRAKTRLLGFENTNDDATNPFLHARSPENITQPQMFPVGWIMVVEGPGRGAAFALHKGVSQIGRGEDQAVRLDFGDTSISRSNHAAIAYDDEQNKFFLGHGGKANLVKLNQSPVLSTEELINGALIGVGESKLRFVAACTDEFTWDNRDVSDEPAVA